MQQKRVPRSKRIFDNHDRTQKIMTRSGERFEVTGYDAIVNPVVGRRGVRVGPVAVMAACEPDLKPLSGLLGHTGADAHRLFVSRLYVDSRRANAVALAGPMIGAPYAAMILESLIVRGARRIVFLGWCGALAPDLKIGDLVVPSAALVGEGTSPNYPPAAPVTLPAATMMTDVGKVLTDEKISARQVMVWTTDAAFRETREQVTSYREKGAVAVDMETSALFAVAAFRRVEIGAVLVVSDSLAGENWEPGFRSSRFEAGRTDAHRLVDILCRRLHQRT